MHVVMGLVIVIVSFFIMPYRFVVATFNMLGEIGREGRFEPAGEEDIPLLSWLLAAGKVVITAAALLTLIIWPIMGAIANDFAGFILGLISGAIVAFLGIWAFGLYLELISLSILLVRNTRRILQSLQSGKSAEKSPQ